VTDTERAALFDLGALFLQDIGVQVAYLLANALELLALVCEVDLDRGEALLDCSHGSFPWTVALPDTGNAVSTVLDFVACGDEHRLIANESDAGIRGGLYFREVHRREYLLAHAKSCEVHRQRRCAE
jgi:hypothetical protein